MSNLELATRMKSQSKIGILHTNGPQRPPRWPQNNQRYPQGCCVLLCPFDASMQPSHKNLFMLSGFLHFPTTSHSRMTILHTHGHRSPHSSPKTTRDTPRVAVFCFVSLLVLVCVPPMKIFFC